MLRWPWLLEAFLIVSPHRHFCSVCCLKQKTHFFSLIVFQTETTHFQQEQWQGAIHINLIISSNWCLHHMIAREGTNGEGRCVCIISEKGFLNWFPTRMSHLLCWFFSLNGSKVEVTATSYKIQTRNKHVFIIWKVKEAAVAVRLLDLESRAMLW